MSFFKTVCVSTALVFVLPLAATATTTSLAQITVDYGTDNGVFPSGTNPNRPDSVLVEDRKTYTNRTGSPGNTYQEFTDIFDFGNLGGATIGSIVVSVEYTSVTFATPGPGTSTQFDPTDGTGEVWWMRLIGTDNSSLDDDVFVKLPGTGAASTGTFNYTLDAASELETVSDRNDVTPTLNTAWTRALNDNRIVLRFREPTGGPDKFELLSATVEVFSTPAPIPLPASGVLLFGALGGLGLWKRRKRVN